jgi:tetrapyrrole methylase family protein / MazG family protein
MKSFNKLINVMRKLRGRKGCPWDRRQTHKTLLKYLYEESDELKKAIRKRDWRNMEEELGDILLQVIFHAQLAREKGHFTIDDVIKTLIRKLTLRHPHVFGYRKEHTALLKGRSLKTEKDVLANWDLLKTISVKK